MAHLSSTCFDHSCGHLQGGEDKITFINPSVFVGTFDKFYATNSCTEYGTYQPGRSLFHTAKPAGLLVLLFSRWGQRLLSSLGVIFLKT